MKIEIKHSFSGKVLFAHEEDDNSIRSTVEVAVGAGADLYNADLYGANLGGANLYGADLRGANLGGANLRGANLGGANLCGADLYGADLRGANLGGANLYGADLGGADLYGADLRGANLGGADLYGADLYGADLRGANLGGATLVGERPILQVGPIGSRQAHLTAYITDKGVLLSTGCFFGDIAAFRAKLAAEHGDNVHAKEYTAALILIELHAELWTPKEEK